MPRPKDMLPDGRVSANCVKKRMTGTQKYNRRTFVKNTLPVGGVLLLSQNIPVIAEPKFLNHEDTSIMNAQTVEESIKEYVAAWNEMGAENMKAALGKCWMADSSYADPNNSPVKGPDGLAALIQRSHDQMPGRKFSRLSEAEFHHGSGCFKWLLTKKNGDTLEGLDYFEYNAENQITRIVGFFKILA